MTKPRMGRPLKGARPMGERLQMRLMPGEKDAYETAAKSAGITMSDWIRDALNSAAKRALKNRPTGR